MRNSLKYLVVFGFVFCFVVGGFIQYSFADTMDNLEVEESSSEEKQKWQDEGSEYDYLLNEPVSSETNNSSDDTRVKTKWVFCGATGLALLCGGVALLAVSMHKLEDEDEDDKDELS